MCKFWCVAFMSVEAFIEDQGTFVVSLMALLLAIEANTMVYNIVALFAELIDGIASIIT